MVLFLSFLGSLGVGGFAVKTAVGNVEQPRITSINGELWHSGVTREEHEFERFFARKLASADNKAAIKKVGIGKKQEHYFGSGELAHVGKPISTERFFNVRCFHTAP